MYGKRIMNDEMNPAFRVEYFLKDLAIALE